MSLEKKKNINISTLITPLVPKDELEKLLNVSTQIHCEKKIVFRGMESTAAFHRREALKRTTTFSNTTGTTSDTQPTQHHTNNPLERVTTNLEKKLDNISKKLDSLEMTFSAKFDLVLSKLDINPVVISTKKMKKRSNDTNLLVPPPKRTLSNDEHNCPRTILVL